jgi:DHA2 family multidrug resistance protein-like MFS transporter
MVVGSMLAAALARRLHPAYVIAAGLAIAGVGLLLHTQVDSVGGLALLVSGLVLASFSIALPMALTMNLVLGSAPPEKAGSAASISETSGEFGVALGVAALGSLGIVVYCNQLTGTAPTGVPTEAANAAHEGITAAVTAAGQLPGGLGTELLDAVRAAFTSGLNAVGGVGALIFVGLAILALTTLRRGGQSGQPGATPAEEPVIGADIGPAEVAPQPSLAG